MIAGKAPLIISGFYLITTGITIAANLKLRVANSTIIHFLASESGSIFGVPSDRADEQLNTVNPRVLGSFTPSQVNYVGLDFIRQADDSTTDLVEFIDTNSLQETPVSIPLARTVDYRIVISTLDFDNNPGIAPIAKVTVDGTGNITAVEDARSMAFRLGSGGTVPNIGNSFGWPSGRKENTAGDTFVGGDKAITSFKGWMDSIMTRLWEVGGGEYWYSPTTYGNERLSRSGAAFVSSGEYFEWDGTNLHWKGLTWIFANSTGVFNDVANQTTSSAGLTDLADGECIYVDVDRTANRTGGSALNAVKAPLATLGTPVTPGSRYVLAWRHGANVFTRDQSYFIGSAFQIATVSAAGMVKLSATDSAPITPAHVATVDSQTFTARAAGLTRGYLFGPATPSVSDFMGGSGDITIGGGGDGADGHGGGNPVDFNVIIQTHRTQDEVIVQGGSDWNGSGVAALSVTNTNTALAYSNLIARFRGREFLGGLSDHVHIFLDGSIGFDNILNGTGPATPNPIVGAQIRSKIFFRDNGVVSPNKRDQLCVMWFDGSIAVISQGPTY